MLCGLSMVGYTRFLRASGVAACRCIEVQETVCPPAPLERSETLPLALAALAAAKTASEVSAAGVAPDKGQARVDSPGGDDHSPPPSKEEILARERADALTLDTELSTEEVDPFWATKFERETTEAVGRLGPHVRLDEVTCRETICRARVRHLDPGARGADVDRLLSLPVIAGQAVAYAPPENEAATVLYFSRKGTTLSVLQPPPRMVLPASAGAIDP